MKKNYNFKKINERFIPFLIGIIFGFLFILNNANAQTKSHKTPKIKDFECKVVKIRDGDTFLCSDKFFTIVVRMADINTPEKHEFFNKNATAKLFEIMPIGSKVKIKIYGQDRYFRSIATVYLNNKDINLEMVKNGSALVYKKYLHKDKKESYLKAENYAKLNNYGVWKKNKPFEK